MLALRKPPDVTARLERDDGGRQMMTTGDELTGYEATGPLFSQAELERHKPPRRRRKLDWGTATTVGASIGIALAIVAAGVAWGAAEGYSPGRIVREIVHGGPRVRTVTRLRTGTAAGPVAAGHAAAGHAAAPAPVPSFAAGRRVAHHVTAARPQPAPTAAAPGPAPAPVPAPAPTPTKVEPPAAPTTAPTVPVPTTVPPRPVPTTATSAPATSASITAIPTVSTSP